MNEWAAVQEQSWGTVRWILHTPGLPPGFGESESRGLSAAPWLPSSTTLTFLIWNVGLVTVPLPQGHHHRTVRCAASQAILGAGGGAGSPRQVGPG